MQTLAQSLSSVIGVVLQATRTNASNNRAASNAAAKTQRWLGSLLKFNDSPPQISTGKRRTEKDVLEQDAAAQSSGEQKLSGLT